jgi:hypothetical protein
VSQASKSTQEEEKVTEESKGGPLEISKVE